VSTDLGHNLDGDQQLALGADTGLRGWDPDTFDGTSRVVANLEWRHVLTGEVLHLGIIGGLVFVDAGKTWAPRVGPSTDGIRKDAGVGVLIESTRAALLRVIRVEVAFPDRGGKAVFLISGSSLF
jgi:hemolysin activation/secretion protein